MREFARRGHHSLDQLPFMSNDTVIVIAVSACVKMALSSFFFSGSIAVDGSVRANPPRPFPLAQDFE
jgi:hypothetical protein